MKRIILLALLLVVVLSACTTGHTEVVGDPNDPSVSAVSLEGAPVYFQLETQPSEVQEIFRWIATCPLSGYSDQIKTLKGLDPASEVRICAHYGAIANSTLYLVLASQIPAKIEPGMLIEEVQGIVTVAGRVTAMIVIGYELGQLGVSMADLQTDVVINTDLNMGIPLQELQAQAEGLISANAIADALPLPRSWSKDKPDKFPWEALDDAAWHALVKHISAACAMFAARHAAPEEVYYSPSSANKGLPQPSLIFMWDASSVVRGVGRDSSACLTFGANINQEFPGQNVVPVIEDLYLAIIVGQDVNSNRYFMYSAYVIEKQFKYEHLCAWNYRARIYPLPPSNVGC